LPFTAPKKYWKLYDPNKIQLADNKYPPKGVTPFTMSNYGELRNYYQVPKGKEFVNDDLARHLIHGYYACVSYIDAQIGRIMNALNKQGLRKNTIVILWGDHGWKLGEHGSWAKHTNFEIDCNAPLIISDPRFKDKGVKTSELTEFVDIYPTLCELCELPKPDHLEGVSFVPLMKNPDRAWKKAAFSIWVHKKYRYDLEAQIIGYAMKTDRYRYIEWKHTKSGEIRARELYDHQVDPSENVNEISNPEYADTVKELQQIMKRGWRGAKPKA
jgi:arylsulfatase A-like enzyme